MNERIKQLRLSLKMSQQTFGARLGVTRGAISRLENGTNNITPAMILSICREFSVNENWLRTGIGNMHEIDSDVDTIKKAVMNVIDNGDHFVLKTFSVLSNFSTEQWNNLKNIIDDFYK